MNMYRCRRLPLWSWRPGESINQSSRTIITKVRIIQYQTRRLTTRMRKEQSQIKVNNRIYAGRYFVSEEARRLVRDNTTASKHELGELLVTNMESRHPGFHLHYFDAYLAVYREQTRDGITNSSGGSHPRADYMRRPTIDDYDRWISILMNAPDNQSTASLAKLIYQDCPGRWSNPQVCCQWIERFQLHGGILADPNSVRESVQKSAHYRVDIITSMIYRRDHVCSLNMGGIDYMSVKDSNRTFASNLRIVFTEEEDNRLIELVIKAYVNPKEVSRWCNQPFRKMKKIGYIYVTQLSHAGAAYLKFCYPTGYWYGTHRTSLAVRQRFRFLMSADMREALNTYFDEAKRTGLGKKALRECIASKYNELRRLEIEKKRLHDTNRFMRFAKSQVKMSSEKSNRNMTITSDTT